jgi:hypothetical protein
MQSLLTTREFSNHVVHNGYTLEGAIRLQDGQWANLQQIFRFLHCNGDESHPLRDQS